MHDFFLSQLLPHLFRPTRPLLLRLVSYKIQERDELKFKSKGGVETGGVQTKPSHASCHHELIGAAGAGLCVCGGSARGIERELRDHAEARVSVFRTSLSKSVSVFFFLSQPSVRLVKNPHILQKREESSHKNKKTEKKQKNSHRSAIGCIYIRMLY